MVRTARLSAVLVLLGGFLAAPAAFAQVPMPEALEVPPRAEPDPLPGLPRLAEEPASLMQAPAMPSFDAGLPTPLPGPYFERDPLLDPPALPAPGCFAAVEIDPTVAHVKNRLSNASVPGNTLGTVHLPSAALDWTAAPRFELGYRLPSGFGELLLCYRFLATDGTGTVAGPDDIAILKSRLDLNVAELNYASRELSLWPHCDMKWSVGLEYANVFFDSRADEPLAAAAAGSGIFERRNSDRFVGFGPDVGLQLARHWGDSGLSLVGQIHGAMLLGRIHQGFFEAATTPGAGGETRVSSSQTVPTLNVQAGLSWHPDWHCLSLFLGYQYEYWWNVGRLSLTPDSRGELSDQGVVLRLQYNF